MDWIIFGLVAVWLGMISWFDIRKKEIPHSLWVIIPFVGAGAYRLWQGEWPFVLIAILVATVSERERISQLFGWQELRRILTWIPLLFLGTYFSIQTSPLATISIVGFWIAWELKWWGGADAVSAIILILIFPERNLIIAFFAVHLISVLVLTTRSYLKTEKIGLHRIAGLPLLFVTFLLYQTGRFFLLPRV